jgi:RNA polymerase sigma factor (sigma-70 family)
VRPVHQGVLNASDEALVAGLATGDTDVALVFVRRFQARVYGLALSITRDRMTAEEVAQDAFLRAWRYAASFDPRRGSVSSWLLTITRNVALDRVRANARHQEQLVPDPGETSGDMPLPEDAASAHDDVTVMAGALRSLPAEQRQTLVAAGYYGFTAREISEAWHVPLGTVKTRLRLAVRKLQQLLTEVAP